jgi:hypothetical protein
MLFSITKRVVPLFLWQVALFGIPMGFQMGTISPWHMLDMPHDSPTATPKQKIKKIKYPPRKNPKNQIYPKQIN